MKLRTAAVAATALFSAAAAAAASVPAQAAGTASVSRTVAASGTFPGGYHHLVVIYEENHSFDNLYGGWGNVGGEHVEGLRDATPAHTTQVDQFGKPYTCLLQNDVNLTTPPLSGRCHDTAHDFVSHFFNKPFSIDAYIHPEDKTCPAPGVFAPTGVLKGSPGALPGGCTRDIVHRFYQEQYQIDGGKQDRYVTGSDAAGLVMGHYRTKSLPIYEYLHSAGAPKYTIADHFFQAAFGGSFLNHQWLIAARSPIDTSRGANGALYSVLDSNAMPKATPLYQPTRDDVVDGQLTRQCGNPNRNSVPLACGSFAVNTVQPAVEPRAATGPSIPLVDDAKYPNIGDRLTRAGISWNWYSGGWNDANAGHPGPLFQFHHQPFNYFANYAPGQPGRTHLKDEKRFISAARSGRLPAVSFVKPYGAENEHPGYASESKGSDHLVDLLETIRNGPQGEDTLVVVTYDEFGGQWDHVSPPTVDAWGPGTRIPALVIGGRQTRSGVDHTVYDTTSILATIEHTFGLRPLSSRDRRVQDLAPAVATGD